MNLNSENPKKQRFPFLQRAMEQDAPLLGMDSEMYKNLVTKFLNPTIPDYWKDTNLSPKDKSIHERITRFIQSTSCSKSKITYPDDWDIQSLDSYQKKAVLQSQKVDFFILTGGPGTGKTTTAAKIIAMFLKSHPETSMDEISIAAPTGRAAGRITTSLELGLRDVPEFKNISFVASTIHRLLSLNPKDNTFQKNSKNPLSAKLILVDEASMVSPDLFYSLIDAIPKNCKLILLGDEKQLPPVDSPPFFTSLLEGDFGSLHKDTHFNLNKNYRSKEAKDIVQALDSIRQNSWTLDKEAIDSFTANSKNRESIWDWFTNEKEQGIRFLSFSQLIDKGEWNTFLEEYKNRCLKDIFNAKGIINKLDLKTNELEKYLTKFQILTSLKEKGKESSQYINSQIEKSDPNLEDWSIPKLVTTNLYNLNLFNGDVGILKNKNQLIFPGEGKDNLPFSVPGLETAFAITVHKAQGSEYQNAIIVLPRDPMNELNTKSMLYTGISRARKKALIVSDQETIQEALKRN